MPDHVPALPTGSGPDATFMRAVWQKLWGGGVRVQDATGQRVNRTTRGTYVVQTPQRTSAVDVGERLFNLSYYNIPGSPSWDFGVFDTLDLGASITGYPAAEAAIVKAINAGRRIHTTLGLRVSLEQLTAAEAAVNFSIGLYTGSAYYNVSATLAMDAAETAATFLLTYSGEMTQAGTVLVVHTEAHAVYSAQRTASTPGSPFGWLQNVSSDTFGAEVGNTTDGKLIGALATLTNATGSVQFHHLTIDSLPAIG